MSWGHLTKELRDILANHVRGKIVADIGAGDLAHSCAIVELGAKKVIAIDPGLSGSEPVPDIVNLITGYVKDIPVPEDLDVVFLAWPVNREIPGIEFWLEKASVVIYFGCNDDFTVCGDKILWNLLSKRMVLDQADRGSETHDGPASFIVYGEPLEELRKLLPEEKRAFAAWGWEESPPSGRRGNLPKKTKPSGF